MASEDELVTQRLAQRRRSRLPPPSTNVDLWERWASVAAGAGLMAAGLVELIGRRRSLLGGAALLGGGLLVYRGQTGYCPLNQALGRTAADAPRVDVRQQMTVLCRVEDAYQWWKNLENYPKFMERVEDVTVIEPGLTRWTFRGPLGRQWTWNAITVEDRENERIAWQAVKGGDLEIAGEVCFETAPGDRGTEIHFRLELRPWAGLLGQALAAVTGPISSAQLREDLRRFKQLAEAGELPRLSGQSSGRPESTQPEDIREWPTLTFGQSDLVLEASRESFPASDAPAWTGVTTGAPPTEEPVSASESPIRTASTVPVVAGTPPHSHS